MKVGLKGDDNNNSGVEVLTTNHVGSSMTMMVDLIGSMVDETVGVEELYDSDSGFVNKDPSSLGGFFGECWMNNYYIRVALESRFVAGNRVSSNICCWKHFVAGNFFPATFSKNSLEFRKSC